MAACAGFRAQPPIQPFHGSEQVVEQIVDFALGFAICGLIGLAFLPLVSARARRLTLAKIESRLPMTLDEIEGDRDLLRARFAVENRALEVEAAEARDIRASDAAELGRRAVAVMRATERLDQTTSLLDDRNRQLAKSLEFGEKTQAALDEAQATLERRQEELSKLHGEFDSLADDARKLEARVRELETQLATTAAELQNVRSRLQISEAARSEISTRAADLSSKNATLAEELAEAEQRSADFEARRTRLLAKVAAERRRGDDLESANLELRRQMLARATMTAGGEEAPEGGRNGNGGDDGADAFSPAQELLDLREAISRLGRQIALIDHAAE
jgi:chromosome segregation ATPase